MRRFAVALALMACGNEEPDSPTLGREALLDPETCQGCHPDHYREWSGSMHAYAAEDPIFLAMNRRGQEETGGALGDFCVRCHAPMAVREGATTDGLNLPLVPKSLRGVTCYFCHNATRVTGTHNAPIELADDTTLRGSIADPVRSSAHRSASSRIHDRNADESSVFCGSCHDIVLPSPPAPAAVHLERTFAEWQGSVFAADPAAGGLGCGKCHMPGRDGLASTATGAKQRRVHAHSFSGVDVALTPFPEQAAQTTLVQQELDQTLRFEICVRRLSGSCTLHVGLENVAAGHNWPSGASQDRRAWVELEASQQGAVLYQSGHVPQGQAVTAFADPDLWLLRDRTTGAAGTDVHMFWDVAAYESDTLKAPVTFDPNHPDYAITHSYRRYPRDGAQVIAGDVDRVVMRVLLEPVGLDVLDDLVDSGHLDPSVRDAMPRWVLLPNRAASDASLEWTEALAQEPGRGFDKQIEGVVARCVSSAPIEPP